MFNVYTFICKSADSWLEALKPCAYIKPSRQLMCNNLNVVVATVLGDILIELKITRLNVSLIASFITTNVQI